MQQLMDLFKLTPAEARFARALARGKRIDEYATQGAGRAEAFDREKPSLIRVGQDGDKISKGYRATGVDASGNPISSSRGSFRLVARGDRSLDEFVDKSQQCDAPGSNALIASWHGMS